MRQADVAKRAGISPSFVSSIERGHLDAVSLRTLRRVASVLDIRVDVVAKWRGGELDRLLSRGHSALADEMIGMFQTLGGWEALPEVSFAIYGERGVIDILAWHAPTRSLLVIELKTDIVDVNELVGTMDRKRRLAARIARERGWVASSVSSWVVVTRDRTNERRISAHRRILRAVFPATGVMMRRWLAAPTGTIDALSLTSNVSPGGARQTPRHRVRPTANGNDGLGA